jgi:nicotinamide riboside kinase
LSALNPAPQARTRHVTVIAVLGAECTGKTTLAQALAVRIEAETGLRCAVVGEALREWVDRAGRTPLAHEQASIARLQHDRIRAAADTNTGNDLVIADTTALMTAVYSRLIFGDRTLDAPALALHRADVQHTLLTALDLPWVADGLQRDGPHVQVPVDDALRELLGAGRLPWHLVGGSGPARLDAALDALVLPLLQRPAPRRGLFSRLAARDAAAPPWQWACESCDQPECEHRLLRRR